MYKGRTVSLVIPCYNEAEGLACMLPAVPSWVDEVVVADNASTDQSAEVARRCGALVVPEPRRGYGYAIQAGLDRARGDILVVLDGDNSYPVQEIESLLEYMESQGKDLVSGCRYPLSRRDAQPALNVVSNFIISWCIRLLFRLELRDSQSGMIAFRKEALLKIGVRHRGMGFSQEIKIRAAAEAGLACGERHILYLPRKGEVKFRKFRDGISNLWELFSLWIRMERPR